MHIWEMAKVVGKAVWETPKVNRPYFPRYPKSLKLRSFRRCSTSHCLEERCAFSL